MKKKNRKEISMVAKVYVDRFLCLYGLKTAEKIALEIRKILNDSKS